MNKALLWGAVIIIILIGGWYWYSNAQTESAMQTADMGTYAYTCDNGSAFTMKPSADVSELVLEAGSQGMFTGSVTVYKMGDGNHFETTSGTLIVLSGAGETVDLTVGEEKATCNPVPNAEMAPWNWGDTEAGSVKPDASLVVYESIQGKWQSTQDPKSVREFRDDGTMVDIYDGKVVSTDLYVAFTKDNAPKMVAFPIEDNAVYIQATQKGTAEDTLNFKVVKLTPDELELIYMDRGGTLTYKAVK